MYQAVNGCTLVYGTQFFNIDCPGAPGAEFYASLGYKFCFANIPDRDEFTALFDYYSIRKVVVNIIPCANTSYVDGTGTIAAASLQPMFMYHIDHDDVNPYTADAAGVNQMRQRHNYKSIRLLKNHRIVIKPRCSGLIRRSNAEGGLDVTSGNIIRPRRLDMTDNAIDHFGLKMMFTGLRTPFNATISYKIETIYYFKCSGPR